MDPIIDALTDFSDRDSCDRCGSPVLWDHRGICRQLARRRELWSDGWIDLASFGLSTPSVARRWPEHVEGPRFELSYDAFGNPTRHSRKGPWVRCDRLDEIEPIERAAALAVVIRLRPRINRWDAVEAVLQAPAAAIGALLRPDGFRVTSTGCGEDHLVRIVGGLPVLIDHDDAIDEWPESGGLDPDDPLGSVARLQDCGGLTLASTRLGCDVFRDRWLAGAFGETALDLYADGPPWHRSIGRDEGLVDAIHPVLLAFRTRLRIELLDVGAADHWDELNVAVMGNDSIPVAVQGSVGSKCLVEAPARFFATWPGA